VAGEVWALGFASGRLPKISRMMAVRKSMAASPVLVSPVRVSPSAALSLQQDVVQLAVTRSTS
jgi:hypothetical protein